MEIEVTRTKKKSQSRAEIRQLIRKHVSILGDGDFEMYIDSSLTIHYGSIVFPVSELVKEAPPRWLAFVIKGRAYLVSRQECMTYKNVDDSIIIDPACIINIPMESDNDNEGVVTPLQRSNGAMSPDLRSSSTVLGSSREDRANEETLSKTRQKYSITTQHGHSYRLDDAISLPALPYDNEAAVLFYFRYVCDFALIKRHFKDETHRLLLQNKLLAQYNKEEAPYTSALPFLEIMVHHYESSLDKAPHFENTNIRHQQIDQVQCRFLEECVEWEVFKLQRSMHLHQDEECFSELASRIGTVAIPEWTLYHIGKAGCYWRREGDCVYHIRFEWFASMPQLPRRCIRKGMVALTRPEFYNVFIPLFYGEVLRASFRSFLIQHRGGNNDNVATIQCCNLPVPLPRIDQCKSERWLLEYVGEHLNPQSCIVGKIAKRDTLLEKWQASAKHANASPSRCTNNAMVSELVDIEDLGPLLPPCLSGVLKKGFHAKNGDRRSLVNYLVDMGYALEKILLLMNGCEKGDIIGLYNASIRKRRDLDNKGFSATPLSLSCGGMINLDPHRFGNTIRCHYEEACNGEKRRNNHTDEKYVFRQKCTESLHGGNTSIQTIYSPIDYIRHGLNK